MEYLLLSDTTKAYDYIRRYSKLYTVGLLRKKNCENCHNNEYWLIKEKIKWFTLFFLQVFPLSHKSIMVCSVCNHGGVLDGAQRKKITKVASTNLKLAKGFITPEKYKKLSFPEADFFDSNEIEDIKNNQRLAKYLENPQEPRFKNQKLIGVLLLLSAFPFWFLGDREGSYNGFLVFCGWLMVVIAIIVFNKKSLGPTKSETQANEIDL